MYHGTDLKTAKIIITSQKMEPSRGDHHWLGDGVYFYKNSKYAFRWIVIKYTENFKNLRTQNYKKIFQEYTILTAEIESDKIFDLDDPEKKILYMNFYNEIVNKSKESKRIQEQLNDSGFADGVILNILFEKMGFSKLFDYVTATFPVSYLADTGSRLGYIPELQICVKNEEIINNIREVYIEDNFPEYQKFVDLYRKTKTKMKDIAQKSQKNGRIYKKKK